MSDYAKIALTEDSRNLFVEIVKDLCNWLDCTPCFNHLTAATRGNLTDLKRKGLVSTFKSDGEEWIALTSKGVRFAEFIGLRGYIPAAVLRAEGMEVAK